MIAALASSSARAAVIDDATTSPILADTWTIGRSSAGRIVTDAVTAGAVYSNDTNFTGYAANAGANGTTKYTALLADDINTTATTPFTLGVFTFSITNLASVSQTVSPYLRFFDTNGTGGGPGALLGGVNFAGITVAAGSVNGFSFDASSQAITLPASFWACEFFSTTSTAANAELIGEGLFNPVNVGTSADQDFGSSTVGTSSSSFTSSNPAGTVNVSPFGGAPPANFEFEFNRAASTAVPEPASLGLLATGISACGLIRRRRAT